MDTVGTICCLIYYSIATLESVPSIIRIIKRKSSADFSIISTVLAMISGTAWTTYIFLSEQTIIVYIGSIWDMIVLLLYTIVVFKYHKTK